MSVPSTLSSSTKEGRLVCAPPARKARVSLVLVAVKSTVSEVQPLVPGWV